jgi:Kef-type K+ transport system membrane component KefB
MDTWKQVALGSLFALVAGLIFQLHKLPYGFGRYLAYFIVSVIPGYYFTRKKVDSVKKEYSSSEFFMGVLGNTFLILLVSTIVRIFLEEIL